MTKMMEVYNAVRGLEDEFVYEYDGGELNVHIRKYISSGDKVNIANEIYKLCYYYDENGNMMFRSSLFDPIKKIFFVNVYCVDFNIDLSEDGEACIDFVMNTDFFDKLVQAVGNDEYYSYSLCIDEYIDFILEEHRASISSSKVDRALSDLINKVNAIIPDGVDSEEYKELVKRLVSLQDDKELVKEILDYHGDSNARQDTDKQ